MMKRKLKQLFAVLLAIMLLLSALPAAALAQDADPTEQAGPLPTEEETSPAEPSPEPTPQEQAEDGAEPSPDVTAEPSPEPTAEPSPFPTAEPSPVPTAEPSPAPVVTEAPSGEPEASPDGEGMPAAVSAVQQVQALIDALPDAETITEDNRADVEAQLTAIDEAKLALTDDERALLDVTRYEAAAAALLALDGLAGADQPMALAFEGAAGGAGTADSPYQISTKEQLKAFRDYINDIDGSHGSGEYFKLTADIDLENEPWTPIGNNDPITFQGTFDGGGHTISGLKNDGSFSFQGLFGSVGLTGTVKNLAVSGTVTGPSSTGGIVGSNYGTVENCRNACAVSSNIKAGGIVGGNSGTVKNCYNTGAVSGSDEVGGVAGSSTNGTIENCYNTGTVSGGSYTGGIVGQHNTGTVKNCYNTGTVSGSGYVGAIAGINFEGTIDNCYYLDTCGGEGDKPKTAGQFWFLASALGEGWVNSVEGRPVLTSNMEAEPAGSSDAPFEIPDKEGLEAFRDYINDIDGSHGNGEYFKLTADIDLENEPWTPIGNNVYSFLGTFDGGEHTVSGLYINGSSMWAGFFGVTNGTVKNLTVAGSVTGDTYSGGIAGQNNGTVENCYNACTVSAERYPGGVVGQNVSGTVKNCYNTGAVSGLCAGGITADNTFPGADFSSSGTVENCYNTGTVSGGSEYAGGVVGSNAGTVENCYNTGTVSGSEFAGGIVGGSAGTIENSYYLDTCGGAGDGTPKTAGQFASGQVAYLLQKGQSAQVWGQTAGGGTPELTDSPEKKVYQIRFVTEDGTDYHTAYANPDGLAALPDAPEKEGYTFKGWATVSGGSPDFAPRTPVSADMTVYAVFQQTPQTPEPRLGDLTVTVTVSGEGADPDRQWHFRVELGDKSIGGQYGDMLFTAGVAEFALKHGQSTTARDLPEGTAYAVTELEADQDGYTAACTGQSGTIVSGQPAVAAFVNDMPAPDSTPAPEEPDSTDTPDNTPAPDSTDTPASPSPTPADSAPQTGDPSRPGLWLALLLLSLTGLTAAAAGSKSSAGANARRRRK